MDFLEGLSQQGAFLKNPDGTLLIGTGGQLDILKDFQKAEAGVFFIKDFYTESFLRYAPQETFSLSPAEQAELMKRLPDVSPSVTSLGTEDETYKEDFRDLKKNLSGQFRKAVLISRETFKAQDPISPLHYFKKALSFGAGIPYGLWGKDFGIVGSTPEELFDIRDGELHTYALAGTSKAQDGDFLLHSEKDRYEHDLVIQDIVEKLDSFTDRINTGETRIVSFKNISHLRTDISAAVAPDLDLHALVCALSPTAALGGYPKKESLRFLRQSRYGKKFPERAFGSAMGFVSPEDSRFIVMIRNIQWRKDQVFIECGGGVVHSSELPQELEEIGWKRRLVREHYL